MKKIKELIIERLETTISKFCKDTGVNRTTVDGILNETYNHDLSLVTIKKICKYFDVDFKEYLQ
jgi:DNA-binding XRE family transcriptional regulator